MNIIHEGPRFRLSEANGTWYLLRRTPTGAWAQVPMTEPAYLALAEIGAAYGRKNKMIENLMDIPARFDPRKRFAVEEKDA